MKKEKIKSKNKREIKKRDPPQESRGEGGLVF
ncbi:hypothetical protein HPELS_01535 [Helicobacter pylori ELS37]|uniref:Uncharacterized protein n=1 Tax=Helicobacter pylori ELS37 TaxID=1055527 RepID=A0ABC7ZEG7_HELPX|nr:hypothetical protein HPELS_01535 [Helicobacter pylori ELS37]